MSAAVQQTLAQPASLAGTSLHTGNRVTLTIKPAPPGHGFQFRRIDLADEPFIEAKAENVRTVERSTTLAVGSVKVHTVEHVLSALVGMGVDNALIEMDANEPPIGDGSALPYVELIKKAGVVSQDVPRAIFEVRDPITLETKQGNLLTILPDKEYRISCTQMGPQGRFTQFYSTVINEKTYEKEIAPARTFVFYEEVQPLWGKGLIKGGSIENAIVVRDDTVMSKEPMRFAEEFARHKILDIVGDLALCGRRLMGHIIAIKPGHASNTEFAKQIAKAYSQLLTLVPPVNIPTGKGVLDIHEIMRILPHRYPFLLVDRIVDFEGESKCTGVKQITINEPFFPGHFPGHPVMPGVLQIEAMAQTASIMLLRKAENHGKIGYFMSADKVKFRKPVFPGETLFIEAEMTKARGNIGSANCRCIVHGEVVSEAQLKFSLVSIGATHG